MKASRRRRRSCARASMSGTTSPPATIGRDGATSCQRPVLANLHIQLGYMFRYHEGFSLISDWARSGLLGEIFAVRAHMSTSIDIDARRIIARHRGGIFYDLAGHMIDQIVWMLGRPAKATAFFRQDGAEVAGFSDNTLGILEYPRALATIDIAAMETPPMARRFEVYGSRGSAILEPFEPAGPIRLCLSEAVGELPCGRPAHLRARTNPTEALRSRT